MLGFSLKVLHRQHYKVLLKGRLGFNSAQYITFHSGITDVVEMYRDPGVLEWSDVIWSLFLHISFWGGLSVKGNAKLIGIRLAVLDFLRSTFNDRYGQIWYEEVLRILTLRTLCFVRVELVAMKHVVVCVFQTGLILFFFW